MLINNINRMAFKAIVPSQACPPSKTQMEKILQAQKDSRALDRSVEGLEHKGLDLLVGTTANPHICVISAVP